MKKPVPPRDISHFCQYHLQNVIQNEYPLGQRILLPEVISLIFFRTLFISLPLTLLFAEEHGRVVCEANKRNVSLTSHKLAVMNEHRKYLTARHIYGTADATRGEGGGGCIDWWVNIDSVAFYFNAL